VVVLPEPVGPVTSRMPWGRRINRPKASAVSGPKPSRSNGTNTDERSRRRITMDSPWMVGPGGTRMAQRGWAPVARSRPSWGRRGGAGGGGVESRHDLDARGPRGLQPPRRGLLVVEQAVDAVADAQGVVEGLDVDVRRLVLDRLLDEEVDEAHHRGLEGEVAQ